MRSTIFFGELCVCSKRTSRFRCPCQRYPGCLVRVRQLSPLLCPNLRWRSEVKQALRPRPDDNRRMKSLETAELPTAAIPRAFINYWTTSSWSWEILLVLHSILMMVSHQ